MRAKAAVSAAAAASAMAAAVAAAVEATGGLADLSSDSAPGQRWGGRLKKGSSGG
jgi:phosphate-selective porin